MSKNHFRVLTNEDLKKVSGGGGKGGASTRQIGNITFSGHVGKYNGVVGQKYYITFDYVDKWYYGVMVKTWEKKELGGLLGTVRTHKLRLIINNGANVESYNIELEFDGDNTTLYTNAQGV